MRANPLIFLLIISIFTSCNNSKKGNLKVSEQNAQYNLAYKTPEFQDKNRVKKIVDALPVADKIFKKFAEEKHLPGLAYGFVIDNKLVYSGEIGIINTASKIPVSTKSQFRIASMSKSFTAMAIMKLRDEGKLSLQDSAAKFIPELSNFTYLTADAPAIKIENLLTMTSGFPEDNPWGDRQLDATDEELIDIVKDGVSFSNVPAYEYEYSNLGFALLGNIITRISGMPYQEYITKNIFEPLGMNDTYWEYTEVPDSLLAMGYRWKDEDWVEEPYLHDGAFGAMGGLITSIDDFSKYVSFHLSAWPPKNDADNGPVKRSSIREMHQPKFPRLNTKATDAEGNECAEIVAYGYGLRISKNCNGVYSVAHSGGLPGFGSNYVFYPDYGVGIMSFCNLTYKAPSSANAEVMDALLKAGVLEERTLPVSDILLAKKDDVIKLINEWNPEFEKEILAENFYLDIPREDRIAEAKAIFEEVGKIKSTGSVKPLNQLRGTFLLHGEKGDMQVYFTLTPQKDPKVQMLILNLLDKNM